MSRWQLTEEYQAETVRARFPPGFMASPVCVPRHQGKRCEGARFVAPDGSVELLVYGPDVQQDDYMALFLHAPPDADGFHLKKYVHVAASLRRLDGGKHILTIENTLPFGCADVQSARLVARGAKPWPDTEGSVNVRYMLFENATHEEYMEVRQAENLPTQIVGVRYPIGRSVEELFPLLTEFRRSIRQSGH